MAKTEWMKKTIECEIKKGPKGDWWFMKVNGKKIVFREVKQFFGEEDEKAKKDPF